MGKPVKMYVVTEDYRTDFEFVRVYTAEGVVDKLERLLDAAGESSQVGFDEVTMNISGMTHKMIASIRELDPSSDYQGIYDELQVLCVDVNED